jgi:hypothetical protein
MSQPTLPQTETVREIFLGPPHHVTDVDIFGRTQTAIGIATPTGWDRREIVYTLDEVRARVAPEKTAEPQKPKPQSSHKPANPPVFEPHEWPKVISPDAIKSLIGDEPSVAEAADRTLAGLSPQFFIEKMFGPDDLLRLSSQGLECYGRASENISKYDRLLPNPIWSGRENFARERRYMVLRFIGTLDSQWKRASHLSHKMPLVLTQFDSSTATLEFWFDIRDAKPANLKKFVQRAAELGADIKTTQTGWLAKMPAGVVAKPAPNNLPKLLEGDLVEGRDHFGRLGAGYKNLVLYFRAPECK